MAKYRAKVYVLLKEGILDAEGEVTKNALITLGFAVEKVKVGKLFEIIFETNSEEPPENVIKEMCEKLLANPVVNTYVYEIEVLNEK